MKGYLCLVLIVSSFLSFSQIINIPDLNLKLQLVNGLVSDTDQDGLGDTVVDTDGDGEISMIEANNVTHLYLVNNNVNDLTGIQFFSSLELIDTSTNLLNNADFNNMQSLNFINVGLSTSLNNFDITGCNNLESLNLYAPDTNSGSGFRDLVLPSLPSLLNFSFRSGFMNSLDISNCQNLEYFRFDGSLVASSFILGLPTTNTLKEIEVIGVDITSLDLSNALHIETVRVKDMSVLSNIVLYDDNSLKNLYFDNIAMLSPSNVNFSNYSNLETLHWNNQSLTGFDLSGLTNLSELNLAANSLSTINLNGLTNLLELKLGGNNFTTIDLTGLPNLLNLYLSNNSLTTIDLSNNNSLELVDLTNNNFSNIDLSANNFLKEIHAPYNNLTLINLTGLQDVESIDLSYNSLSQLDLNTNINLKYAMLDFNNLTQIDLTNNVLLEALNLWSNNILAINLENNINLRTLDLDENQNLVSVNVKAGRTQSEWLYFGVNGCVFLEHICVDEVDRLRIVSDATRFNPNSTVVVNSYCSFTPGGTFNEIEGNISVDIDNNGCDPTDPVFPNFNFTATDGTISGSISSNQQGAYYVPVADGQHTITPNPENPTYWNFSPSSVVVDFPTQTSPFTQDFCVTANGSIEDLEVIVVPLEQARPGFDTDYKVVVKNKGNVTTSGTVTLDFEEDFINLLSSTPTAATPATNQLSWSVSNLQPFQMEEYEFTMTLNTPTQTTNPLNGNDILTFTGVVTGTGTDAMPADNTMVFDQTVVNSYDPNDKTCLEGKTIDPSDVGEYVHYMIRFENTGTASAVNIVVKDEIDLAQFDITTLIPLGGSHDYYTRVRDNNVVEFIHENINLDFNDATNDGYVLFKIKTLSILVAGDTFDNTADIFFDFNAPIVTNTETVSIMSTASVGEVTDSSISIYPNPVNSFIHATANNAIESISITDINGRMITATQYTGAANEQRLEIGELSSGIYFVIIKSNAGQKIEKLVVE
ncbi:T9SS type A sorting domain-containing protein [Nonlabens sp. Asnod2-A12]|uniref:T9SS type A sorting domain-containing protein n=1 Tax=Nonlabens sp. Asnod2-A12 TaxID=3160578 RepID=UPI0038708D6A